MSKKVFAINAGSSSLKFQLLEMPEEKVVAKGLFERIGLADGIYKLEFNGEKKITTPSLQTHKDAVDLLLHSLIEEKIITSLDEIEGVGHRVAHGGEYFKDSAIIDEVSLKEIERLAPLAPSHNPVNLVGIYAFQEKLPHVKNVAVFDTSFHQTMEKPYYIYPIPYEYYKKYKIRKYGFHGTSHQYVANQIKVILEERGKNTENLKIINCHLGNGASICAIKNGRSVNTSMGFTPLAGLMMGSRSGDIDPTILTFLQEHEQLSYNQLNDMMNKESGLLGVSGTTNDLRDVLDGFDKGDKRCQLAIEMYVNRIAQTIATYIVDLNGVDIITFTAGVGENARNIREMVVNKLEAFNIKLDKQANENNELFIHDNLSKVMLAVVPTNEEIMIGRDVVRLLNL